MAHLYLLFLEVCGCASSFMKQSWVVLSVWYCNVVEELSCGLYREVPEE
jgi:hypothetical protein